jgi:hypothetical protein
MSGRRNYELMTLNYSILKFETCNNSLISRGLTASRAASVLMSGHFFHALPYEVLRTLETFFCLDLGNVLGNVFPTFTVGKEKFLLLKRSMR